MPTFYKVLRDTSGSRICKPQREDGRTGQRGRNCYPGKEQGVGQTPPSGKAGQRCFQRLVSTPRPGTLAARDAHPARPSALALTTRLTSPPGCSCCGCVLTLVLPGCAHWLGALGACSVRRLEPCSPTVQPCPPAAHPGGEGCPGGLAGATAEVSSRAAVTSCLFVDIPSFLQMTHPERSGVGGEQSCLG